ncbi:MAG: hypothetical protein ACJ8AV_06950 [Gemmatimonadales bacterium]
MKIERLPWFPAFRQAAIVILALPVPGLALMAQADSVIPVPPEYGVLEKLGVLRLERYSIHGYAPLVALFTEAAASAPQVERTFRSQLTRRLVGQLDRMSASLFTLRSKSISEGSSAAFEAFQRLPPWEQPQVIIGFGDGAVAAARLLTRDSSRSALLALAPAYPGDSAGGAQAALWQELFRSAHYRGTVLVLESECNRSKAGLNLVDHSERGTVLILPQYDGWLAQRRSGTCPAAPTQAVALDYHSLALITDWLKRTLHYPQ